MINFEQRLEEEFARQREEQERFYGTNVPFLNEFSLGSVSEHSSHSHHQSGSGSSSCSPVSTPGNEMQSQHNYHS